MVKTHLDRISLPSQETVSSLLEAPSDAHAMLVLAHGAGAGMRHATMDALAEALHLNGVATLRFQFRYMEQGTKRPDPPKVAVATIAAAVRAAAKAVPGLPLFAGGKSFGGRMTTTAASLGQIPEVRGLVCFGFPLHPPKKTSKARADHFETITIPILLIQGTRDALAELTLIKEVAASNSKRVALHIIEGADHSFGVLRKLGRSKEDVLAEVACVASEFCKNWPT